MYANGLILSLALQSSSWELRTRSVFDNRRGFTEHPTDIVRALLAIEMLKRLTIPRAGAYAKALRERLVELHDTLPERISWVNRTGAAAAEIDISTLEPVLRLVADVVMNAPLKALCDQSLNQVMPWTNTDEKAVRLAAASLLKGQVNVDDTIS